MNSFIDNAPVIGLIFFFVVFVVIAFMTYRPSAKKRLQANAFIPLKEDNNGR